MQDAEVELSGNPSAAPTVSGVPLPGASQEGTPRDRRAGVLVIVNRASGVGHASIACRWLLDVPPGALRRLEVELSAWPPRLRLCPSCFPSSVPLPAHDGQPLTTGVGMSPAGEPGAAGLT